MISHVHGQVTDSIIYDINHLRSQSDRVPEFFRCSDGDIRYVSVGYSISSFSNLEVCLSKNFNYPINELNDPIKQISLLSADQFMWSQYLNARSTNPRYKSSAFKLELDDKGNVTMIETIRHCIEAISESNIISTLENTVWRPALRNLKPIGSSFIIEIEFNPNLCHQESWSKTKADLYRRFPVYRKELMDTYLRKGTMWDLEILTPMMKYEDESQLSKSFDSVEILCRAYLNTLNSRFNATSKEILDTDCDHTSELVSKWESEFYEFMDETIKSELTRNNDD
jgi:hypothetical protein